jgi:hypothetical protein
MDMRSSATGSKKLFVCTKPYQYMIARLIKQGCGFEQCDVIILDHFFEAEDFCKKARETEIWNRVLYFDDGMLDDYKLKLNPIEKFFFYQSWKKFLPSGLEDISMYSEVFLAHDFVAIEYAIMRKFSSEGKKVTIFEEGYGNYINNSTHESFLMKGLKRFSPWLGLPGGYIGSLKWIDSIWVQRPNLIREDVHNPLRLKTNPLPMLLKDFLQIPEVAEELYHMYPELNEIDMWVKGHDVLSVVLTESWHDSIANREQYVDQIIDKVNESIQDKESLIFIKQHPGESMPIVTSSKQVVLLPKQLPFELLFLTMMNNNIKKVNLFSFGSTAILNLYDLCRHNESLKIYLFSSLGKTHDYEILFPRFCDLATKYHVQFNIV